MKLGCHYEKYMKKVKQITNYKEMITDIEEAFGDKKWCVKITKRVVGKELRHHKIKNVGVNGSYVATVQQLNTQKNIPLDM